MPPITETLDINHLFAISEVVSNTSDLKTALDGIARLTHRILLFDNLAVYLLDKSNSLNVTYAKAMGRGQKAGAESAWGEQLASLVAEQRKTLSQSPTTTSSPDHLKNPYLLGVPLMEGKHFLGVVVLIRFGGPPYVPQHIKLAEFIARQIVLLIARQSLAQERAAIEKQQIETQIKEDFISTISHELRTPLGFIKGYTTTLLRSDTEWDVATQKEFLQIIEQETDQLQELIENILDSARLQSGQMRMAFQPVRLDVLLKDAISRLHMSNLILDAELDIDVPPHPIEGDPSRLSQVFENILNNAAKYAPGAKVYISIRQNNGKTHIAIRDTGPGIPEDSLERIFERFFRIPDTVKGTHGTGLGLFICKQIIHAHHGEIKAESTIGKGTTFHITLPDSQAAE